MGKIVTLGEIMLRLSTPGQKRFVQSDVFVLALCLSMVVIRDAMGVRRSSGIQAKTLNSLGNEISRKTGINYRPVKEIQGHKPVEVVCGALMGFFIGVAFSVL